MKLKLFDPILELPITATVHMEIANEIEKCGYVCGPLHIQIINARNTQNGVEQYLKDKFDFTITNSFAGPSCYHIYTSTRQYEIQVPVLKSIVIDLEYFILTDNVTMVCCVNAILNELIKITPFKDLKNVYDQLVIDQDIEFEVLVLRFLRDKKRS